jgi:hypothetical protein
MFEQFTYEGYIQLLNAIRTGRQNLCFSDFRAYDPPRFFLLRHDIDFSLGAALKMAQLEAEHGFRATYFLLLSCEYYNLLAEGCCKIPRQLVNLGHEVGLHYDVRAMAERAGGALEQQLQFEMGVLETMTGRPIHSIAMHNPSVYGDDPFAAETGFVNAYHDRFTKAIAYYSDSCGAWRDAAYEALNSLQLPERFQLLIHPFFWSDMPGNRWDRLNIWVEETNLRLKDRQEHFRQLWLNHAGVREHESRLTKPCT